jgi:lambda repressor-like predicted transcriptional regulator
MANMKSWLKATGITYRALAVQLSQSDASISQKVNLQTNWQKTDCIILKEVYGLPSDFVMDIMPYEELPASLLQQKEVIH